MKLPLSIKSSLLVLLFTLSSCATVKYGDDPERNNYSNLQTGKNYVLTMKDGGKQKILFSRITDSDIIGFTSKKDSTIVTIPKGSVKQSKDVKVANAKLVGGIVGAAAVTALIITSSKAD